MYFKCGKHSVIFSGNQKFNLPSIQEYLVDEMGDGGVWFSDKIDLSGFLMILQP